MKDKIKPILTKTTLTVICIYIAITFLIFVPYYNWNYVQKNGFLQWVFFGEIVSTAKGVAWPYFILYETSNSSIYHFSKAIDYANKARASFNKDTNLQQMPPSELDSLVYFYQKALVEAEQVNIDTLNEYHAELGDYFINEFTQGIQTFLEGYESKDLTLLNLSEIKLNRWGYWYNANINEIRGR